MCNHYKTRDQILLKKDDQQFPPSHSHPRRIESDGIALQRNKLSFARILLHNKRQTNIEIFKRVTLFQIIYAICLIDQLAVN